LSSGLLIANAPSCLNLPLKVFKAKRNVGLGEYKFTQIFIGVENSPTLLRLFGSQRSMLKIIHHLKLGIVDSDWGIWLDHNTGSVCIGSKYLASARINCLYLDVIHVLVHVKQFLDGRDLYDQTFEYVDRPTEIEAYRYTIDEAKRLQMSEDEILKYLRVDAVDDSELGRLIEKIGVRQRR
jgi:hypothetical protein